MHVYTCKALVGPDLDPFLGVLRALRARELSTYRGYLSWGTRVSSHIHSNMYVHVRYQQNVQKTKSDVDKGQGWVCMLFEIFRIHRARLRIASIQ